MADITTKPIVKLDFPEDQYRKVQTDKVQITLHHTVSGNNAEGVANWWKSNPERVATCMIIDKQGIPYQLFSSKYFGYHLGVKTKTFMTHNIPYLPLDQMSIAVELISWGGITKKDNKYYNVYAGEIKESDVIELDKEYRGFKYYDKYTDAQIKTLKELLVYWGGVYNIPLTYHENMFDFNLDSLKGTHGIWSHTSYREDKSDIYPDPKMIEMLKSLTVTTTSTPIKPTTSTSTNSKPGRS